MTLIRLGMFVVVLLTPSFASAYRTGADAAATSDTPRVRWASSTIPMRLYADVPGLSFGSVETIVLNAMSVWDGVACSDVSFSYRGSTSTEAGDDGTNTIQWHRYGWEQLGFPADAAGTTDLVYERNAENEWVIVEADVHLNAYDFTWVNGTQSGDDLRSFSPVIVHELGHVLGLLHPCEPAGEDGAPTCGSSPGYLSTTMYPLYQGPEQASLEADDIAGACFLYPSAPCVPACEGASTCREGQCVPTCGGVVCGEGEACIAETCMTACSGYGCLAEGPCTKQRDCSPGYTCHAGLCLPFGGQFADPCALDEECASGVCFDGACSITCHGSCGANYACELTESGASACAPEVAVFGEPCTQGEECASAACLVGTEHTALCTRACGPSDLPCPETFACRPVDGVRVCVPASSGGCTATPTRYGTPLPFLLPLLLLVTARRHFRRSQ